MSRHTLSDEKMIEALERGREQLLSGEAAPGLLQVLRRRLQSITRNIYILQWIPEQDEDLYDVLIDGAMVAHVEIPRANPDRETVFEVWPVEEQRQRRPLLSRPERRKSELALRLARTRAGPLDDVPVNR